MRRTLPTGRKVAPRALSALAGLLLTLTAGTAPAEDGVVRVSDGKAGLMQASHTVAGDDACAPDGCTSDRCAPDCCAPDRCAPDSCAPGGCRRRADCDGCDSGRSSACRCGGGCGCGKSSGLIGKMFGGKDSKHCRCGKNCRCSGNGSGNGSGLRLCGFGSGDGGPIGSGYCPQCGRHGLLYGPGYCPHCCGVLGIPCCLPGIPVPGIPVPGCFAGHNGAIAGSYARVYAVNPYYHDFRDGAVYAAQGYNAPISVPLAPNVDYTMNYGWGMPSSRLTPISRVVPSPYAVQPTYAVPPGYVPAGSMAPQTETGDKVDLKPGNGLDDPRP